MADKIDIVRLDEDQLEPAAEMLARFLNDQPHASLLFGPDPEARMRIFREGYMPLLRYCSAFAHPHVAISGGQMVGIALWMPPHGSRATPEEEREFGLDRMPATFGEPVVGLRPLGDRLRDLHERDMKAPHWFLAMMVVDPSRQGSGIGSALIRPILLRADEGKLPCYTDTTLPAHVDFYARHGFKVVVDDIERTTSIRFWTLSREPQPYEPPAQD